MLLADDVASAPPEEARSAAASPGMVYAFKIAGAKAEEMADLDAVTRIAQKAADACRSIGMALTPCTVPQAGKPTFQIGDDEMEMGMGIHGEPGIWRDKLRPADAITDEMIDRLSPTCRSGAATASRSWSTRSARRRRRSSTSCTAAPARGSRRPASTIVMPLVGRYATSMEMTGATVTLCRLDGELERLLEAPCHCAFWTVVLRSSVGLTVADLKAAAARLAPPPKRRPPTQRARRPARRRRPRHHRRHGWREVAKGSRLPDDLGMTFLAAAKAFQRVSPSSYGTLTATALMAAAKHDQGQDGRAVVGGPGAGRCRARRDDGAGQRRARRQERARHLDAVARKTEGLDDPAAMLAAARGAIDETLVAFRGKPAKLGRARMFAEKSMTLDDPGMVAFQRVVNGLA